MGNAAIVQFVIGLVKSWDLRRSRCFGRLVAALMRGGRLGVAAIGRQIATHTADKHHIKAVDRFLGNEAIDLHVLWASLMMLAAGSRSRLYVLIDWTDLHDAGHECLVAAVSYGGRAVPVAWTTSRKSHYFKSRNRLESGFCLLLKSLVPVGVELVVIADRGFGRASLMRALRRAKIRFVIRIRRDVHIIDRRGCGPVGNRDIARGQVRDLVDAQYSDNSRIDVRCVITFGEGDGKNRPKQPWYLVTDLQPNELPAVAVVAAYKLRMRIEHNFRDHKSLRFGFQLRSVRLTKSSRYDRLLAIAAVAILLLVHLGIYAESKHLDRGFRANTQSSRTHSLFFLGLAFFPRLCLYAPRWRLLRRGFDGLLEGMS